MIRLTRLLTVGFFHLAVTHTLIDAFSVPRQRTRRPSRGIRYAGSKTTKRDSKETENFISESIEQFLDDLPPKEPVWAESTDSKSLQVVPPDSDFVSVARDALTDDQVLRVVSSEIGIRHWLGEESDDAEVARAIILQRTLDTIEDIMVHLRRIPYNLGISVPKPLERKTVVVLGSGWGSHALMKVADCLKIQLIVVSPTNHFVFTPMLASAAVGTVEYRSMTESVRRANPMIHSYIEGKATDVDVKQKTVTVKLNSLLEDVKQGNPPEVEIPYDHLVVAVGNQVAYANVPGAQKHCLTLKSCDDARRLRTALGECFEYASRPGVDPGEQSRRVTFVVVGGGPTGVELVGEISDLAQDITRPRVGSYPHLRNAVRVVLVHGGSELLLQFDPDLRKEALRALEERGVEVRLNTRVIGVTDDQVTLSAKILDERGKWIEGQREESTLPMGVAVWCAGISPVPFIDRLLQQLPESARGQGGRVKVDRWLRCPTPTPDLTGSILVLGDAASIQSRKRSLLPQTAQVAGQQGAYAARLLSQGYDMSADVPVLRKNAIGALFNETTTKVSLAPGFSFLNLGLLAYLGGGNALSQVQVGDVRLFSYVGSAAFVLWRSVYLVKQVATRNRVLVTFDWIKSALFGRDTTRL